MAAGTGHSTRRNALRRCDFGLEVLLVEPDMAHGLGNLLVNAAQGTPCQSALNW